MLLRGLDVVAKSCNFASLHYNELVYHSLLFNKYKVTTNNTRKTNDMQPSRFHQEPKKEKRRGKCHTCKHTIINMNKSGIWYINMLRRKSRNFMPQNHFCKQSHRYFDIWWYISNFVIIWVKLCILDIEVGVFVLSISFYRTQPCVVTC